MTGQKGKRIGFVSTRLAGTDGVTLETHNMRPFQTDR
jgi:hypothetical protein